MTTSDSMLAARIHHFGPPEVITLERLPVPTPGPDQVRVRIAAAGVGPWDAWVRAGKSAVPQPLPLTLGSDLAGIVDFVGSNVTAFGTGDRVFGVPNGRFTDGYAEVALMETGRIARMAPVSTFLEAASLPVIACTAWQMLHERARVSAGQRVLVLGAAGNVGAMVLQLARFAGVHTIAVDTTDSAPRLLRLGASEVLDSRGQSLASVGRALDAVIDAAGGARQAEALAVLKPGGILISAVSPPDAALAARLGVRAEFFLVDVNTAALERIAQLIAKGHLAAWVGTVLGLEDARLAHEMLLGTKPYLRGKLILQVDRSLS